MSAIPFRCHGVRWPEGGKGWACHWEVVLVCLLLLGCVTPPVGHPDLLEFLKEGVTSRQEVLLNLGQPSASFEQEHIFTYRVGRHGEAGYYIMTPRMLIPSQNATWDAVHFSLVLVFDEQGVLRRHKLIRVD